MAKKKSARKSARTKKGSSKGSGNKRTASTRSAKRKKGTTVKSAMGKTARKVTEVAGDVLKGAAVGAMKGATETIERKAGRPSK